MKYFILIFCLIVASADAQNVLTSTSGTSTYQPGGSAGAITNNEARSVNLVGTSNYVSGVLSVIGSSILTNGTVYIGEIIGVTDASASTAGYLGEVVSSAIASGSATALTTATAKNVTSISLTAGDWDVSGNVNFSASSATVTGTSGGISTTSATVPTDGTEVFSGVQVTLLSESDSVTLPRKVVNVSSTTTVYLVGKSTFSAGSVSAFGSISARRIR